MFLKRTKTPDQKVTFDMSSIGDLLVSLGIVDEDDLARALAEQLKTKEKLGAIFVRWNRLTEKELSRILGMQSGLRGAEPEKAALSLIKEQIQLMRRMQLEGERLIKESQRRSTPLPFEGVGQK